MSQAWRNKANAEVVERYHQKRNKERRAIRVSAYLRKRDEDEKELEKPVDKFMEESHFNDDDE